MIYIFNECILVSYRFTKFLKPCFFFRLKILVQTNRTFYTEIITSNIYTYFHIFFTLA